MRLPTLLACLFITLQSCHLVTATCVGNSCAEQHQEAKAQGLLGSTSCSTKTYPSDGKKLTPKTIPTPVLDVLWSDDDKYVYVLTRRSDGRPGGRLYRSEDYGKSLEDTTSGMAEAAKIKEDAVGVMEVLFRPNAPAKMFFQGPDRNNWVSDDYGKTFKSVPTPGSTAGWATQVRLHPTQPLWMLSKVGRDPCTEDNAQHNKWCAYDLFISQDFGSSWTNMTEQSKGKVAAFWDFEWGAALKGSPSDQVAGLHDETIFATVYEDTQYMKGPFPGWDKNIHFVVSHDFFKTVQKLVPCGNQFEVLSQQVFVATPSDCPVDPSGAKRKAPAASEGSVMLYVSTDGGSGGSFTEVCLPVKYFDKAYNLVRTHDGSGAFIVVDHAEDDVVQAAAPMSDIYSQGSNSSLFTVAMRRNYRQRYVTDFVRVEGLPGVYLGNQLDGKYLTDPFWEPSDSQDYTDIIQTKVSFNGGSHWQELEVPQHFRHPECNACPGPQPCSLHLHGPSSWHYGAGARPSFYSHESTPGLILAAGNVGYHLDLAADPTCTWLSRDGGASWEDVAPRAAIYEFGDHGGILVLATHFTQGPADSVQLSLDEGACWHTVQLAEPIDVENIRMEPDGANHVFVVHGQACRQSKEWPGCTHTKPGQRPAGKIYIVDVFELLGKDLKVCKEGSSDYEQWSPPTPNACLLGLNLTLQRQRRDATCLNGVDYERHAGPSQPCQCSQADIECEYGYEWVDHGCQAVEDLGERQCTQLSKGGYLASTTHHRLVHGDQCSNVSAVIFDTDGRGHPPGTSPGGAAASGRRGLSGVAAFFVSVLVIGVVVAAFGVWWTALASDGAKAFVEEAGAPVINFASSAWGWLVDRFSGVGLERLFSRRQAHDAYFEPLSGGEGLALDEVDRQSPPIFR